MDSTRTFLVQIKCQFFRLVVSLTLISLFAVSAWGQRRDPDAASLGITMVNARDIYDMVRLKGLELPRRNGVVVLSVMENSPAAKAGIVPSSLIRSFNNQPIQNVRALLDELANLKPGTEVNFHGMRPWVSHGNRIWRSHSSKITPLPYREVLMGVLSKKEFRPDRTVVWSHCQSPHEKSKTTYVSASIRQKGKQKPALWITNHYCSINWMRVGRTKFVIDEAEYELDFELINQEKDGSHMYEWTNVRVDRPIHELLESIVRAGDQDVIVRYFGIHNEHERLLTTDEKSQLALVLEAFEMMGGEVK